MPDLSPAPFGKDDFRLVTEAKAGSYTAFEELVNRCEKKIYRLGLSITGNPEDAEEVLQESFLKAFEHLHESRQDARFYTWLGRVAVNEGLMKLRRRRSDRLVPIGDAVSDEGQFMPREMTDWKPNPEKSCAQGGMEAILLAAARALPPPFRTVLSCETWRSFPPRRRRNCSSYR